MSHALGMHEAIVKAIEQRDPVKAAKAAEKLISDTYDRNFSKPTG